MPYYPQPAVSDDSHSHTSATLDQARVTLSGSERSTLAETTRMRLEDLRPDPFRTSAGSVTIFASNRLDRLDRMDLAGNARTTVQGTGRVVLYGLVPIGRLVLAGRGG